MLFACSLQAEKLAEKKLLSNKSQPSLFGKELLPDDEVVFVKEITHDKKCTKKDKVIKNQDNIAPFSNFDKNESAKGAQTKQKPILLTKKHPCMIGKDLLPEKEQEIPKINKEKKAIRHIEVKNTITPKMLTYEKHWYKPTPSKFSLFANGTEIKQGSKEFVELENNVLTVCYECEFKKLGILYHREKKEIIFEIPAEKRACTIDFSWDSDNRIAIADATSCKCNVIDIKTNHVT
jgi:hypothetical protein